MLTSKGRSQPNKYKDNIKRHDNVQRKHLAYKKYYDDKTYLYVCKYIIKFRKLETKLLKFQEQ